MKLAEIQIDRCGVWRELTLPLEPGGLNVLYGPNEAGKSTLVQFLRGVLYGFEAQPSLQESAWNSAASGSLLLDVCGDRRRLFRAETARVAGEAAEHPLGDYLADALQGINGQAFDTLFSIDLRQLQELGALSGDEAAARIYNVSLGPDGLRLIETARAAQRARGRFVDSLQQDGELVRLFEQHDQLEAQLRQLGGRRSEFEACCRRRDECEGTIADLQQRQSGIAAQLRGHRFLEQAWGPWNTQRECRRQLADLPPVSQFPEGGLERLDRLDAEIAAAAESRDRLLGEAKRLGRQLPPATEDSLVARYAGTLRGLVEQKGWMSEVEQRRSTTSRAVEDADRACATALDRLGSGWTAERLAGLDLSAAAWQRMSGTAQSLTAALDRKRAMKRRAHRLAAAWRERRQSLDECVQDLDGQTIESALHDARERLRQMNHLARLQVKEAELNQRQFSLIEQRDRIAPQLSLPRWVYIVLGVFAFMGIFLAGLGLVAGVSTSGIAGAIYAMLGVTCGGLAWGLRFQFEGDARRRMEDAATQYTTTLSELREVRDSIARLADVPSADTAAPAAAIDGSDLVRRAAERVAELVDLAQHQRALRALRRRYETCRHKLQVARREVETAQAAWRTLLSQFGLSESVPPADALEAWQRLLEASQCVQRREQALAAHAASDGLWSACRRRIAELGRRLEAGAGDVDQPLAALEKWESELDELTRRRQERKQLKVLIRKRRREAAEHRMQVEELKVQRHALLVQAGAASREEFEERARLSALRKSLEEQSSEAQAELEVVSSDHTDLALVEEDLLAYNADENARCIEALELESADLERDLLQAHKDLEAIRGELHSLEQDRTSTSLRFDLEQVRWQLQQSAREWAATELAAQAADDLRREYERRNQPQALTGASRILGRLTQGRYASVWAPLGERRLMVEDETGRRLAASALSRGTREQLFLAVRLAVVEDLARQGVTLPLILDDVFVNFDERRSEAAAEVLCDFAQSGHQVLFFTCHLHLARMFQAKGIEPIWLPDRRDEPKAREEQRRAG